MSTEVDGAVDKVVDNNEPDVFRKPAAIHRPVGDLPGTKEELPVTNEEKTTTSPAGANTDCATLPDDGNARTSNDADTSQAKVYTVATGKPGFGWHLFDLGSTHGTWRNKQQIPPKQYIRVHVGHMLKFGGSTRLFILNGPSEDEERESSRTVTEIKKEAERRKLIADGIIDDDQKPEIVPPTPSTATASNDGKRGISWGMDENDDDENGDDNLADGEDMDYESLQQREQYYREDPKKALKRFFDREGADMVFDCNEKGSSFNRQWHCRIELPAETTTGKTLWAEATVGSSKKDAQTQCALEACRLLDAHGVLRSRPSGGGDAARRRAEAKAFADNDYYDDDEDNFFDRTGQLESKRQKRQSRMAALTQDGGQSGKASKADTYDDLLAKLAANGALEAELNAQLAAATPAAQNRTPEVKGADDPLDHFMTDVRKNQDGTTMPSSLEAKLRRSQLRLQLADCSKEKQRLERMAKIAKPAALPALETSADKAKKKSIWVGSIKGQRLRKVEAPTIIEPPLPSIDATMRQSGLDEKDVVEEEENDDDDSVTRPDNRQTTNAQDSEPPPGPKTPVPTQPMNTRSSDANDSIDNVSKVRTTHRRASSPPLTLQTDAVASSTEPATSSVTSTDERDVTTRSSPKSAGTDSTATSSDVVQPLSTNLDEQKTLDDAASNSEAAAGKSRTRHRVRHRRPDRATAAVVGDYDASDPDFAVWLPPDDQAGDGMTLLNKKFGY